MAASNLLVAACLVLSALATPDVKPVALASPGANVSGVNALEALVTASEPSQRDDTYAAMEAAIKSLMVGKSSFGATPMGGSVKKIKNLLTKDMMPKVLAAHKSDQRMLHKLVKDITSCGKIKANGFRAGKSPLQKYTSEGRSHKNCRRDEAVKLTSLRTCRREEKSLLQIKKLKCNAFASVSRKWGFAKNNAIIVRKSGGESVLSYITRISVTFCGSHIHGSKGTVKRGGGWGGGLPNGALDKYLKAKYSCEVATKNYNNKVKECRRKQRAYNSKKAKCNQYQALMDSNSCKHAVIIKDTCEAYSGCYYPKVKDFRDFERKTKYMERDRKAEWRGLKRMSCLIDAFADGKVSNKEVDVCRKMTVKTSLLNIEYPKVPPLKKCVIPNLYPSTGAYKRKEFSPLPSLAKGKASPECSGLQEIGTKPRAGSPKGCKCRRVPLTGPYSAGAVVKCTNCKDVYRSSQKNSCPRGTKLFSPASRADWKSFIGGAGSLRSPHWIVDVTRPQNGCGGCTSNPMNSGNSRQKTWKTADGTPWWLRSSRYNEPNGDYNANCYMDLWHNPRNENSVTFNDWRCKYHSKSYYCQLENLGLKPRGGSPKSCRCRKVDLSGSYSPGNLVKCEQCRTVYRSTQKNSCPAGMKIFSPRSRRDWKTFLDSAGPLRAPHWIIDVTRPQNGCGGCTRYPMRSSTAQQATWKTADSSPWWLRNSRYNEPNGDYTANCYLDLWRTPKSENTITFNDGRCNYRSRSYYCQPIKAKPKKKVRPPAPMGRSEGQARAYCSSLGWNTVWKSSKAIICTKPGTRAGSNCNTCSTWRLVVYKNGATDQCTRNSYATKAGSFYCGHKPCRCSAMPPYGGLWKSGKKSIVFKYLVNKYPQNKNPSAYCPKGSTYMSHACGTGADRWTAKQGQRVQWGPWKGNQFMNNKYKQHCWTSCNCNRVKIACVSGTKFVDVKKKYPQNAYVGSFCPKGTKYVGHACGTGANKWTGTEKVQWGPYTNNAYLKRGGHCARKCNCNRVRVRCQ